MPKVDAEFGHVVPNRSDAIRVVPVASVGDIGLIQDKAVAGLTPPPLLTYRGGPVLGAVEIVTVFWGKAWNLATNQATVGKINAYFDAILTSTLMDQLAEYSTPTTTIGHGQRVGSATITAPNVKLNVSDAAIQHFLQQQIGATKLPAPSANTLYFIYLPPECRSPRAVADRARCSVAITATSTAPFSTRSCPTRRARAAPARWLRWTR